MTVALALDVVAAIMLEKNGQKLIQANQDIVKDLFSKIATDPTMATNADLYQKFFSCCGEKDHSDWSNAKLSIPNSCCNDPDEITGCNKVKNKYKVRDLFEVAIILLSTNFINWNTKFLLGLQSRHERIYIGNRSKLTDGAITRRNF